MAVYLTLILVVILFAAMVKQTESGSGLKAAYDHGITRQDMVNVIVLVFLFAALFGVSALRVNVGNDYAKYVEFMHLVYSRAYVPTEAGFNALTYAVYYLCGYENFILVFAIFAFGTLLFFFKALWQQSEWFFLSFMMFMLLGYYFQSISTVRYYLALGMAMYSIKFVIKRDWPKFILVVLIGCLFHKSVLVVLALYPIARLRWKRWMVGVLGILCVSCLFLQDFYLKIVVALYPSYKDTEYLVGGTSYVSIARCALVLVLSLYFYKDMIADNRTNRFYFNCNNLALALYVFGSFLPIISRIGYYLTVTHILFIPAMLLNVKDYKKKRLLTAAVVLGCLVYFAMYMKDAGSDGIRILPYQTFLYHEMPLTLSERGY
ncbi:EpsG family protein [Butyrivibrio proteoclasticus]|uniref:EpsG family protein n=1 Tax=Butyrivibrio proteoclasticus TaxID=43305 RepID=UPI00047E4BDD|nr:EpsG family protein [Butyrivibrio proteoclasticus]